MTPPVVAFNKDWGRSSGIPARCQVVTNPHNTFDSPPPSGALIGQKFEDPEVKREMNMVAQRIVSDSNGDACMENDKWKAS